MSGKVVSVWDLNSFLHHHVNVNSFFQIEPRFLFNHTYTKPSCKMGALIFEQSNFNFSFICTPHKLEIDQQVSKYHISVSFSFSFSFFTSKFSRFLHKTLSHYWFKYSKNYSVENTFILSFNWHLDQICLSQNFNKCIMMVTIHLKGLKEGVKIEKLKFKKMQIFI